jgi:predicted TIM-barrel fold metal-dependent hydrolase
MHKEIDRRTLVGGMIVAGTAAAMPRDVYGQTQVPNSSGTDKPSLKAPLNACDCHHHIYDGVRYPPGNPQSRMQSNASVAQYRLLQRRIGTARNVIVTPAPYVFDNHVTLDAIAQIGPDARGVAVVRPNVTDAELRTLDDAGIRGIRFTQADPVTAVTTLDMIEPLARRVAVFGWHVQIHMLSDQIVAAEALWNRLPAPIVFDHMGRMRPELGAKDPGFAVIRRLIDKGRTWVKLSGAYMNTALGPPRYADATALAQAYAKAAPERMVWGSDWPHPTEAADKKPNDAVLFDLLSAWVPDETMRHRILVENPETLYAFPRAG